MPAQQPLIPDLPKTIEVFADGQGWGQCRGCGRRILWATIVKSGKKMCFNSPAVALTTRHDDDRRLIESHDFNTNHWASCPDRDKFKGGR